MQISEIDRIKLFAQFSILHQLQPNNGWGVLAEIVENGYEEQYDQIKQMLFDPMSEESCREVGDILTVFDILQRPYVDAGEPVPDDKKFPGFDGNNESRQLSYFRFLREKQNSWTFIVMSNERDHNSHFPLLGSYRRMLRAWNEMGGSRDLTQDQIAEILAERVHPENRS